MACNIEITSPSRTTPIVANSEGFIVVNVKNNDLWSWANRCYITVKDSHGRQYKYVEANFSSNECVVPITFPPTPDKYTIAVQAKGFMGNTQAGESMEFDVVAELPKTYTVKARYNVVD